MSIIDCFWKLPFFNYWLFCVSNWQFPFWQYFSFIYQFCILLVFHWQLIAFFCQYFPFLCVSYWHLLCGYYLPVIDSCLFVIIWQSLCVSYRNWQSLFFQDFDFLESVFILLVFDSCICWYLLVFFCNCQTLWQLLFLNSTVAFSVLNSCFCQFAPLIYSTYLTAVHSLLPHWSHLLLCQVD